MALPFQVVEENLRSAMRCFALAKDIGETRHLSGVLMVCSGVDFAVFNSALLTAPVTERDGGLARRIAVAAVHFQARGLRWSYWVCEDLLEGGTRHEAKGVFSRHGLRLLLEPPGMLAEQLQPPRRSLPSLEYRRVGDADTRMAFCHVTSVAFELPFWVSREIYDSERIWQHDLVGWVGYRNGEPITTAVTVTAGGAVGVYSVGTLPECQRQGYAEAVMRHAVAEAQAASGIERTVLQSTRQGLRLYERMGYRKVTKFAVYTAG